MVMLKDSAVCGQRFPYFCPETKVPKILHSKGEMARFGEFFCKLSNFDFLNCNKMRLRCCQNLHELLQPTACRQTCADFSPSPWWLTSHILVTCELKNIELMSIGRRPRKFDFLQALCPEHEQVRVPLWLKTTTQGCFLNASRPPSCRQAGCFGELVRRT